MTTQPTARQPIVPMALSALVDKTLAAKILGQEEFTAYDITKAIRADNPVADIPHEFVREQVHLNMAGAITVNGLDYHLEEKDYGGNTAMTYVPDSQN